MRQGPPSRDSRDNSKGEGHGEGLLNLQKHTPLGDAPDNLHGSICCGSPGCDTRDTNSKVECWGTVLKGETAHMEQANLGRLTQGHWYAAQHNQPDLALKKAAAT